LHCLVTFPIFAGREPPRGRALIWRFAHWLVPKRVPDISEATLDANWHVERDPAENVRTAPPDDESIELPCIWMTEVYGPSRLPSLIAAVRRLGWEREEHTSPLLSEGIEAWIARARLHPFGGSWLNLGPIARPGTTGFLGGPRRAPLHPGVSHAYGLIRVLTPALTCLTMQFFLEPGLKEGFDTISTLQCLASPARSMFRRNRMILASETMRSPLWRAVVFEPVHSAASESCGRRAKLRTNAVTSTPPTGTSRIGMTGLSDPATSATMTKQPIAIAAARGSNHRLVPFRLNQPSIGE
jgi:hypothetical protein